MPRDMDILPVEGHTFQFTQNWFRNRNLPTFRECVLPVWRHRPINYLELGCYEGMSMVWILQYILTHPDSKAWGIDPWLVTTKKDPEIMDEVRGRAFHNLYPWIDTGKCCLIRGCSSEVLRRAYARGYEGIQKRTGFFDLCMIDGSHFQWLVLDDSEQCLRLMKVGGHMLFDDVENQRRKTEHVKSGVEMFLERHGDKVEFRWKHRFMECYEKVAE